ncbi:MAG: hypothetical protein Athens071416_318 [Parcubacteria group bacterium Athens0714_16]|nr:MAG: hypothetical protein Athens071416_318 [Parcubacteria group bacterium Athens0714_16]
MRMRILMSVIVLLVLPLLMTNVNAMSKNVHQYQAIFEASNNFGTESVTYNAVRGIGANGYFYTVELMGIEIAGNSKTADAVIIEDVEVPLITQDFTNLLDELPVKSNCFINSDSKEQYSRIIAIGFAVLTQKNKNVISRTELNLRGSSIAPRAEITNKI